MTIIHKLNLKCFSRLILLIALVMPILPVTSNAASNVAAAESSNRIEASNIRGLNGYCLDIPGANLATGSSVVLYYCHRLSHQTWTHTSRRQIKSSLHGQCLTSSSDRSSSRVTLENCDPVRLSHEQTWVVISNNAIINLHNNKCLDVLGWDTSRIGTWSCHGGDNQKWSFVNNVLSNLMPNAWSLECQLNKITTARDNLVLAHAVADTGYAALRGHYDLFLNHRSVGNLLWSLSLLQGFSENEKLCIWEKFVRGNGDRDVSGNKAGDGTTPGMTYFVEPDGAHRLTINADKNGPLNTASHTVVAITSDGYHSPFADISRQEAASKILSKENSLESQILCAPFCPNKGDIEASIRTVTVQQIYKRYRSMAQFAGWWNRLFIDHRPGVCPNHILDPDRSNRLDLSCHPRI